MARPSAPANLILISLTIGAAGLAALAVYRTFAPLVAPRSDLDRQPVSERMRLDLEREKALTLRSIKELEFDRAMGKVSPQDFEEMVARDGERYVEQTWKTELGEGCYEMHGRIIPPLLADLAALGLHRRHGGWVADAGAEERSIGIVAHGGSLGVVLGFLLGAPPFPIAPVAFQLAGVATIGFAFRRGIGYAQLAVPPP